MRNKVMLKNILLTVLIIGAVGSACMCAVCADSGDMINTIRFGFFMVMNTLLLMSFPSPPNDKD